MKAKPIGTLSPPKTLFFRVDAGEAAERGGDTYQLAIDVASNVPIIRNQRTGRWFSLSWRDIIGLAKTAGIDEEAT